jgi:hypothetical protein
MPDPGGSTELHSQPRLTRTCLLLFATLLLAGGYFRQVVEYDNTSSRLYLLSAIVDHGTFAIDAYEHETIDKSFHDGHYYSNKAFGTSFLAAPVYWILRALPFTRGEVPLSTLHRQTVNLFTSTLCFALLGVCLFVTALHLGADPVTSLWMVLAFSFGSIAWIHATMLSGHIMAAALCFAGFAILYRLRGRARQESAASDEQRRRDTLLAVTAGLLVGVGALCDYTAMYLAMVLAVYALWSPLPWTRKLAFLLAGGLCVTQLLTYNAINFGDPLSLSYEHMARDEFAEGASQGLLGVTLPSPGVLLRLLVSPSRGLFFRMPIFLFGLAGLVTMWRRRPDLRAEWWTLIAVIAGYLLINAGFYGWHGGWAHGPRYLVPMLPFLALPMILAPLRHWLFGLAFLVSFLQVLPGVIAFPFTPQIIINPLRDMVLPLLSYGYLAENGLYWLGASKVAGLLVGLPAMAGLALLTRRSVRGPSPGNLPSRALTFVIASALLAIVVATTTLQTERQVRLKVMARVALDAELALPYESADDFMENAP